MQCCCYGLILCVAYLDAGVTVQIRPTLPKNQGETNKVKRKKHSDMFMGMTYRKKKKTHKDCKPPEVRDQV